MTPMTLAELSDRLAITDTLNAYCDRVDRSDLEGLLALFTDDVVLALGPAAVVRGLDELRALVVERVGRWTTTSHHCSTTTVHEYDGRRATTTTYLYAFHDRPADDVSMHMWGRYEDELVAGEHHWRIRRRSLRVAGIQHTASQSVPERFSRFGRLSLPDLDAG